jgi:hypothetical protein
MRLAKQLMFLAVILLVISAGYAQEIHYDFDRAANFQSYRTYQWIENPSSPAKPNLPGGLPPLPAAAPPLPNGLAPLPPGAPDFRGGISDDQLLDQSIKRAVDEQLAQKGLTKVEKNADLQVAYHAALREEKSINLFGSGWRGGGLMNGSVQGQTSAIPVGTLVIDIYDPARKQLIWRGDASKTLDIKKDPNKNYKTLQKAMEKLFKNYPPQLNK